MFSRIFFFSSKISSTNKTEMKHSVMLSVINISFSFENLHIEQTKTDYAITYLHFHVFSCHNHILIIIMLFAFSKRIVFFSTRVFFEGESLSFGDSKETRSSHLSVLLLIILKIIIDFSICFLKIVQMTNPCIIYIINESNLLLDVNDE